MSLNKIKSIFRYKNNDHHKYQTFDHHKLLQIITITILYYNNYFLLFFYFI